MSVSVELILFDCFMWLIFHVSISWVASKIPLKFFEGDLLLFREFKFEDEGKFWERFFGIKHWKRLLPDGSKVFKNGFRKKHLEEKSKEYFEAFAAETRRAEAAHICSILPSFLFFIWNPFFIGIYMVLYALLMNLPCIIAQRYNRPRLLKIAEKSKNAK